MKRFSALAVIFAFVVGALFAQAAEETVADVADIYADTKTQEITVEDVYGDMHPRARTVSIKLDYTPLTGEVRFYYKCMAGSFDQGEAMNTAMAVFEKFAIENQYKHYAYQEKDRTKYSKDGRGVRMATYESHVLFRR